MPTAPTSPDVAVIGGGPAGCLTALSHARAGSRVLLLEAHPSVATKRLAGEWLHPPAVRALHAVGAGDGLPSAGQCGSGFVVFPHDGTDPIVLAYPEGQGMAIEHGALVEMLRERMAWEERITVVQPGRAVHVDGQRLTYLDASGHRQVVAAGRIVGADGRGSLVRRALGLDSTAVPLSSMAGVLLRDVRLPYEGLGHVILGGPGPILAYRVGADAVRLCLDVPPQHMAGAATLLRDVYAGVLPEPLRPAFVRALAEGRVLWAANQFVARSHYGRAGLFLVGDAVGRAHPLTAVGLTLGFLDGLALARSGTLGAYRRERAAASLVPELLAIALYEVLAAPNAGSARLREATYQMWRGDAGSRSRTMRLVAAQDVRRTQFARAFLQVFQLAVGRTLRAGAATGEWDRAARAFCGLAGWLPWLAAGAMPGRVGAPGRARRRSISGLAGATAAVQ